MSPYNRLDSSQGGSSPSPFPKAIASVLAAGGLLGASMFAPIWWWYWWRIEPEAGQLAVLVHKTGKDLPPGEIIAPDASYKGIQKEVLPEGRYFRNPYSWDWRIFPVTDIPAGKFGVLVRKYGKDLPDGQIIAPDAESRGIVNEVLGTGKHRINPYAFDIKIYDDIRIDPGHAGVVTQQVGDDIISGRLSDGASNTFLVSAGMKGVQSDVLKEGTHRINPFVQSVSVVNVQSQRYEFSGDDSIVFLTQDGFSITVQGTIEFNITSAQAAKLSHEVGEMDDIMKKLVLPSARGFARIEGSKKTATEFIIGESRQAFQDSLEKHLKTICLPWGVSVNSVLIRDIIPPQEIAKVIRDRELAAQESHKIDQQIEQAKSLADRTREEMLAAQNKQTVAAETDRIRAVIAAKQDQAVREIAARRELDVAKVELKSAEADAQAKVTMAEAERRVVQAGNEAEAAVLAERVAAYGSGGAYVRSRLYEKLAPRIQSIMTTDVGGPTFGLPLQGDLGSGRAMPKTQEGWGPVDQGDWGAPAVGHKAQEVAK